MKTTIRHRLYALLFAICYLLLTSAPASAITMMNDNYILKMGNMNTAAGTSSGPNNTIGITVGQTAPGLYTGTNYKVKAGFQYIHSIIPFSFSISEMQIDFGVLDPTNPVTRTSTLTVSNGSAFGYTVTASENHQLLVPATGDMIPDTTCDNGSCTESTSAEWASTLTYGFGYRCDNITGSDCASDFTTGTYYKQFADESKSELPQTVMEGSNVGRSKKVQITYKANIGTFQPAGKYSNVITYIATPTF